MQQLMWVLIVVAVALAAIAAWRFLVLRPQGTSIVLRELPAEGSHRWRHGTVHYDSEKLTYYKLRSLSPGPDKVMERRFVTSNGHRRPTPEEEEIFPPDTVILHVDYQGNCFECAMNRRPAMALISWIESAPSERQIDQNFHQMWTQAGRKYGQDD